MGKTKRLRNADSNAGQVRFRCSMLTAGINDGYYWVKERGAKIFKFYPLEDTVPNDINIWPIYEKAQELGIVPLRKLTLLTLEKNTIKQLIIN